MDSMGTEVEQNAPSRAPPQEDEIKSLGGFGRTGVSKKTDYLVVGGTGILQDGRDARESSKYRKA